VRLRAGLAPQHWMKSPIGQSWDNGYESTAYFLDYVDKDIHSGFVAHVNEWIGRLCLRNGLYNERQLFAEVLPGMGWDVLWDQWCNCFSGMHN
jgi:hypothetical protein